MSDIINKEKSSASSRKKATPVIPGPIGEACGKATRLAQGVDTNKGKVAIKTATSAELRTAAKELRHAETAYQAVLADRAQTRSPAFQKACADARTFIRTTKKILSIHLGERCDQSWAEAGFLNNTLRTPKNAAEIASLVHSLGIFLAAHPEMESAPQRVTAAVAQEIHAALTKAEESLENTETLRKERRAARDQAEKALRKMLSGVVHEIRLALPAESPLWNSFGLTAPKPRVRRAKLSTVAASTTGATGNGTVVNLAA